jgi:hypothetical protein
MGDYLPSLKTHVAMSSTYMPAYSAAMFVKFGNILPNF